MLTLKTNKDCCGCQACEQICPKHCITMEYDIEGFLYPSINVDLCNNCSLCEQVCPIINQKNPSKPIKAFAAKNKNEIIRHESSTGGVFSLIAENIINEGGVVFGVKFNKEWEVIHAYTDTIEGLSDFRKSKYVQSKIGNTFITVKRILKEGKKVLFSGTPCQIAGLKLFLQKEYDNLLTVDLVCHGVPSPKVWNLYITELLQQKNNGSSPNNSLTFSDIKNISFRNKINGWKNFSVVIDMATERDPNFSLISETVDKNIYMKGFLRNIYLRPSCYACPCRFLKSGSDITISDFWSIGKFYPKSDDNKGINAILTNTTKGNVFFENLTNIDSFETTYEKILIGNQSLEHDSIEPKQRGSFFAQLDNSSIIDLIQKHTRPNTKQKIKRNLKQILVKVGLWRNLKKILK